ncbi:MAG: beta-galactosidase [Acidobacteriota bacterium]|nr:beta-galactosidase [Acidobacteriota bacterium]
MPSNAHLSTRRDFVLAGGAAILVPAAMNAASPAPWYKRTYRWGQTNITEKDPVRYDIPWWRGFWKRTELQGVIINGGGIVAYYPSKFPLQHQAEFLNGRDLYGELVQAARADGLVVLARMDSNRTSEEFFRAHPDWFARDASGSPYRAADKYITCVNSPYYEEYIPNVMREIIERSHPEGITDNSWSGLGRDSICYCDNCSRKFRDTVGGALPAKKDWANPVYRKWIDWNYARRLEIWDLNNRVTKAAGGPDCLWIGMNSGSITSQSRSFRDCKGIWERADILMLDHQARGPAGFQENSDTGKLIHGIMGWDKLIPESMAMYQAGGRTSFRLASKPAPEARMWMFEGFAGGIQPWWHHIGAYHEDRRMYRTAEPVMHWYKANERYLVNRSPVASVGLVWSQRNTDFYGHDDAADLVEAPYRGFSQALIRARIPYLPVHIDHVGDPGATLKTIILPDIAAMSDAQGTAVRAFVERGGSVIATGVTSLYNEQGDARPDFALADLFGAHFEGDAGMERKHAAQSVHTYLRLSPELRGQMPGPKSGDEPPVTGSRHAVLKGFEETDIMPFGGVLTSLTVGPGVAVPLTFVPEFPIYPPETAWMRHPKTNIPGLIIKGRVAFMPADLDRRYARDGFPDHGNLLANLVRWGAADSIPLHVEGPGLIDCNLYSQNGRLILHLVNLTSAGVSRGPMDELIPVGPLRVRVRLPKDVRARTARTLVAGRTATPTIEKGWAKLDIPSVLDHEVIVIE